MLDITHLPSRTNAAKGGSLTHPQKPRSRLLVVPAGLELVLLDPQCTRKLGLISAQLLDESLGVLAASERFSAERMAAAHRAQVDRVQDQRPFPRLKGAAHHCQARLSFSRTDYRWHLMPPFRFHVCACGDRVHPGRPRFEPWVADHAQHLAREVAASTEPWFGSCSHRDACFSPMARAAVAGNLGPRRWFVMQVAMGRPPVALEGEL